MIPTLYRRHYAFDKINHHLKHHFFQTTSIPLHSTTFVGVLNQPVTSWFSSQSTYHVMDDDVEVFDI